LSLGTPVPANQSGLERDAKRRHARRNWLPVFGTSTRPAAVKTRRAALKKNTANRIRAMGFMGARLLPNIEPLGHSQNKKKFIGQNHR